MKNILLVEDDPFLQKLYYDLLVDEEFIVTATSDGNEAYTLIKSKKWDLVLLDIVLPGMDGFQIVEKLEKSDKSILKSIVYLTNLDGNEHDLKKLRKVRDYLIKSNISPPEFIEKVNNLLSK